MLFARVNGLAKTALEDSTHKRDIYRMAISNERATKNRAPTLETRTNISNDTGKKIKATYLFYKNPSTAWYIHGNFAYGAVRLF